MRGRRDAAATAAALPAHAGSDGPPVPIWPLSRARVADLLRRLASWEVVFSGAPFVVWFLVFQLFQLTPQYVRPTISVEGLPWFEDTFFGGQMHRWLPTVTWTPAVDLLAALAYFLHFMAPWTFMLYCSQTNGKHLQVLWCIGWLNLIAVCTQIFFPTAPPWYLAKYGHTPADYSVGGDAAGLARVDAFFGIRFFYTIYSGSPIVFGSFPSLHAAWPCLLSLLSPYGSRMAKVMWVYALTVWWAAMYLQHHYLVDLIAGGLYTLFAIYVGSLTASIATYLAPSHVPAIIARMPSGPLLGAFGGFAKQRRRPDGSDAEQLLPPV